ncbi:hypothetical protein [Virgibacillus ihumii]|uniref:hypothetical protein n=1 Tax=Virgibacillus ihumii TaxID=2686091 RepID=UPI00157BC5FA
MTRDNCTNKMADILLMINQWPLVWLQDGIGVWMFLGCPTRGITDCTGLVRSMPN